MTVELLESKFLDKSVRKQVLCLLLEDTLALLEQAKLHNFAVIEIVTYKPSKEYNYEYNDTAITKSRSLNTTWNKYCEINNEEALQLINQLAKKRKNKAFSLEIIDQTEYLENLENEKIYLKYIALLKKYQPQKNALLETLSSSITDKMLDTISKADYGWESDVCYPILKEIQQTKQTPLKTEFIVGETLSLTQWGEPKSKEGHLERLFCSTTLIMLFPTDGISIAYNEIAPLAVFLESLYAVDEKHQKSALPLITWRMLFEEEYDYQDAIDSLLNSTTATFYIYTLILLLVMNQKSEKDIQILVEMLIQIDKNERTNGILVQNETFLLGLTNRDQRHAVWKTNTKKMLSQLDFITDNALKETLQKIGEAIIEDKAYL